MSKLSYDNVDQILFIVSCGVFGVWLEHVPVETPNKTYKLWKRERNSNNTISSLKKKKPPTKSSVTAKKGSDELSITYRCAKWPNVSWLSPSELHHGLRASKDSSSHMWSIYPDLEVILGIYPSNITKISQLGIGKARWSSAIIDKNVVRFDVCKSVEIWYKVACKILVNIPVCVYPFSCKAWIAWSTLFATNFTSELSRVFTLDACSRLSSKYCRIKDGGSLVSSSTWRIYGQLQIYFRTLRSFSRRPCGAVLMITFPAWELLFLAIIR